MEAVRVIETAHLFVPVHDELIHLLDGLSPDAWRMPTVCAAWEVRDIAAHLLDVDLRRLSFNRDQIEVPAPDQPIASYSDLVGFLNRLNATWVTAARRLSPKVLVDILRVTGPQVAQHVAALDPMATARFSVSWAGEAQSANWFDIARDFTERWHHQQQIRDAVQAPPITRPDWLKPVLETFLRALPHAYRNTQAEPGTQVEIQIEGQAGGTWTLEKTEAKWQLKSLAAGNPKARIQLTEDTAWRHLTKDLNASQRIRTEGPLYLTDPFRITRSIMAE